MNERDPQFEIAAKTSLPQFIRAGKPPRERAIAYLSRAAREGGKTRPGIVWLSGFKSSMSSVKASALDAWAKEAGRAFLRFDYSGHGMSCGKFEDATIGDWLEESLAAVQSLSTGPQILIGSSMGGWLALLIAQALEAAGEEKRLAGLVLIAPAVDFTERLIWAQISPQARSEIETRGFWLRPTVYAAEPYPITRALIEEGRHHLLFGKLIRTYCPVHILYGLKDEDVPPDHVRALAEHLVGDEVVLTAIKDGDHRLSRPQDIALLIKAIEAIA
jgi:pimeloyl-ACP methyl ester carboxylesterase